MVVKSVFAYLDSHLPTLIRRFPYEMGLKSLQMKAQVGESVWARNSYYHGNFVFGVSDLDITYFSHRTVGYRSSALAFAKMVEGEKRLFPFLGEVNYYPVKLATELKDSANYYEISRDPILMEQLQVRFAGDLSIEASVFILRMIFSDRVELLCNPQIRQKKWKKHLRDLAIIEGDELIDFELIKNKLSFLIGHSGNYPELLAAIDELKRPQLDDSIIFELQMSPLWKVLYPHKYIWFRDRVEDVKFIQSLDTRLKAILKRQIDWEVWGLLSQYILIPTQSLLEHLNRLKEVLCVLGENESTARMNKLLNEINSQ